MDNTVIGNTAVSLFLVVFGVIGNLASIKIWNQIQHRPFSHNVSVSIIFNAYSYSNIGYLFMFLLQNVAVTLEILRPNINYSYFHAWLLYPLTNYFSISCTFLMVSMSVNTFLIVYLPRKLRLCHSIKKLFPIVYSPFVLAVAANLPHHFIYSTSAEQKYQMTDFATSQIWISYNFYGVKMIFTALPVFIIFFSMVFVIYRFGTNRNLITSLIKAERFGRKYNYGEVDQVLTVVLVAFCFLIACVSQNAFQILSVGELAKTHASELPATDWLGSWKTVLRNLRVLDASFYWLAYCRDGNFRQRMCNGLRHFVGKCMLNRVTCKRVSSWTL